MKKLDQTRPFGVLYGNHPASYEQDGFLFDSAGVLLSDSTPAVTTDHEPRPAPAKASRKKPINNSEDHGI